jgi:hypothetical protein
MFAGVYACLAAPSPRWHYEEDEMSTPEETPERKKGASPGRVAIGPWLVVFGGLLLVGLVFYGTRNLFTGVVITPPPIVGEWQAYRTPWRLTFDKEKTVVSATGPSEPDQSQPWVSTPGTYRIDYFGTLWVNLNDGRQYTATLRPELPNQFDLVESATDIVTVFERVLRVPQPIPGNIPVRPSGG